jgi:hypothetical protein
MGGKKKLFRQRVLGKIRSCRYLLVKTTNFIWIKYKVYLFWDFFQQNMGFCCI